METIVADPMTLAYHELRAPLGLVATAARSAADSCEDESQRLHWEIVLRAAERMLRTTHRVLSLAEASQPRDAAPYRAASVIRRVVEDSVALGMKIELKNTLGRETILGSPCQLEALLQSLLSNAIDHGEPDVPLNVTIERDGNCAVFEVRNCAAHTKRHHGLGAGSYLAARLATQMGAVLETRREGEAYIATVTIPLTTDYSAST